MAVEFKYIPRGNTILLPNWVTHIYRYAGDTYSVIIVPGHDAGTGYISVIATTKTPVIVPSEIAQAARRAGFKTLLPNVIRTQLEFNDLTSDLNSMTLSDKSRAGFMRRGSSQISYGSRANEAVVKEFNKTSANPLQPTRPQGLLTESGATLPPAIGTPLERRFLASGTVNPLPVASFAPRLLPWQQFESSGYRVIYDIRGQTAYIVRLDRIKGQPSNPSFIPLFTEELKRKGIRLLEYTASREGGQQLARAALFNEFIPQIERRLGNGIPLARRVSDLPIASFAALPGALPGETALDAELRLRREEFVRYQREEVAIRSEANRNRTRSTSGRPTQFPQINPALTGGGGTSNPLEGQHDPNDDFSIRLPETPAERRNRIRRDERAIRARAIASLPIKPPPVQQRGGFGNPLGNLSETARIVSPLQNIIPQGIVNDSPRRNLPVPSQQHLDAANRILRGIERRATVPLGTPRLEAAPPPPLTGTIGRFLVNLHRGRLRSPRRGELYIPIDPDRAQLALTNAGISLRIGTERISGIVGNPIFQAVLSNPMVQEAINPIVSAVLRPISDEGEIPQYLSQFLPGETAERLAYMRRQRLGIRNEEESQADITRAVIEARRSLPWLEQEIRYQRELRLELAEIDRRQFRDERDRESRRQYLAYQIFITGRRIDRRRQEQEFGNLLTSPQGTAIAQAALTLGYLAQYGIESLQQLLRERFSE